ncbi:hypothetical protein JW835_08575 [bacterium]|nr:hypothetical protein [bacterium]
MIFFIGMSVSGQIDPELDARLERRSHTYEELTLPYRLFVPDHYHSFVQYPLLVFLHGARWSGSDNAAQLDNAFAVYWVQDSIQTQYPSFIVYPQCSLGSSWESVSGVVPLFPPDPEQETVHDLLDSLIREFSIDMSRIYIAGKSMGGHGAYGMLSRYPQDFAAAVIVAGNYVYRDISEILHIPMWLLHARQDNVISIEQSRHVVNELETLGKNFVYTHCNFHLDSCEPLPKGAIDQAIGNGARFFFSEFDTSGHQVEPKVVRTYGLYQWVFSQQKQSAHVTAVPSPELSLLKMNYPNPFNAKTRICYQLFERSRISLIIFNSRGIEICPLLDETQEPGEHWILFDGSRLPSGIYVAELKAGGKVWRMKMALVK